MTQHGRKSTASLTVAPTLASLPTHPDPPRDLSKTASARWREIITDWPLGHWRPSDLHMLRDLVITEEMVRDCDAQIARDGSTVEGDRGNILSHPAVGQRRGHIATIATLQRALRLCPSARYEKDKASLRRSASGGARPWETKAK
jgi:phage terminase small subunit